MYVIQDLVVETHDELVLPPHVDVPDLPQYVIARRQARTYFYDVILLLILVHIFWGIGARILAPGGPREAQWGHQRAFSAGSKMDCPNSFIEVSSEKTSCGKPRIQPFLRSAHEE